MVIYSTLDSIYSYKKHEYVIFLKYEIGYLANLKHYKKLVLYIKKIVITE